MELIDTSGNSTSPVPAAHEVAKCLFSVKVTIADDCGVSLTTNAETGGIVVPAIWGKDTAKTYAKYQDCPTASAAASVPASEGDADIKAAILNALNEFVYGGAKDSDLAAPLAITAGVLTVGNGQTDDVNLKYAIKNVSIGSR